MKNQWRVLTEREFSRAREDGWVLGDYQTGPIYLIVDHHLYEGIIQDVMPYRGDTKAYIDIPEQEPSVLEGHWILLPGGILVGKYYEYNTIPNCLHAVLGEVPDVALILVRESEQDRVDNEDEVALFKKADHLLWVYGEDK